MKRILAGLLMAVVWILPAFAEDFSFDDASRGEPLPYRVLPIENLGAFVGDWSDESMPHYGIIANLAEWQAKFPPSANVGGNKPPQPNPALFEQAALILVARVSAPPARGQQVLFVKSFELVQGEAVLTYGFFPPEARGGGRVKNTMLVAIPLRHVDEIRIIEDIETPESIAAARELEAAKAAGRFKPPALNP